LQVNEDYYENVDLPMLDELMQSFSSKINAGEKYIGRETYNPEVWP